MSYDMFSGGRWGLKECFLRGGRDIMLTDHVARQKELMTCADDLVLQQRSKSMSNLSLFFCLSIFGQRQAANERALFSQ
jgi:hypothetical protein